MKNIIENLNRKPSGGVSDCRVLKPIGGGSYKVKDTAGRVSVVRAAQKWNVGDAVAVSQGWIVAAASRFLKPKVYEV